jgi:zinc transport system ATP-binding protein
LSPHDGHHDHPGPDRAPDSRHERRLLVAVDGLTVRYDGRPALQDVRLDVHAGEIVTLIGPNGAGKTSLVRAVLGLIRPAAGQVRRQPGLTIGYVPQRVVIDPVLPLSVTRFLTLWGRRRPSRDAVHAVLEEVGAARLAERAVQTLSGGEWQRVLLARALIGRPDLLVLDEPVGAVDVQGQIDLFNLIADLRQRRGCGVLLVSHDLHLVMARTDTVVCLNHHVCCSGHPEEVGRHPEYMALFGRGAEALAVYQHAHDHRHDEAGRVEPLAPGAGTHEDGCRHG